jgi:predicted enzyme related to lactoylglutathione lyase
MTELEKVPSDMKLEVVLLGVSDVDRAKAFYENLGWRLDIDIAAGDFRGVQMTPHNSEASIIFGKGITSAKPGSAHSLVLAVDDIDAARDDLIARGVDVSEVFHYAGGPSTTPWRTRASAGATRKVVPTSRLPRSRIRTGTAGCSRRSSRGFPAANGSRREQ